MKKFAIGHESIKTVQMILPITHEEIPKKGGKIIVRESRTEAEQ